MASKLIGIEFGSDTAKFALVNGDKVVKVAVERLPDNLIQNGHVSAPGALIDFLKENLKKHHLGKGDCALVLPANAVVATHVTMPLMSVAELELNLPFEFRDYIGRDSAEFDFDYIVNEVREDVMELYAAAVRREIVEQYADIFKKCGLSLKIAIPAEMAWLNIVSKAQDVPEKLAVIDIGCDSTTVSIFSHGNYVMGKRIEFGGRLFDETIAAQFNIDPYVARTRKEANMDNVLSEDFIKQAYGSVAIAIKQTINYYNYSLPAGEEPVKNVYLCGGSANIRIFANGVARAVESKLNYASALLNTKLGDEALVMRCAVAAGAAMQKITKEAK